MQNILEKEEHCFCSSSLINETENEIMGKPGWGSSAPQLSCPWDTLEQQRKPKNNKVHEMKYGVYPKANYFMALS